MEKKSVRENYFLNMLYQVLAILTPIITAPYISRHLGASAIGTVGYVASIFTYFSLVCDLGLNSHGQLAVAYNQKDKDKISQCYWEIITFKSILTILVLIVYYIMFCINNDYSFLFKLYIISFVTKTFDITWYFNGIENFSKIVYKNILVKILSVVLIFVLIKTPEDINKYALLYLGADFLSMLLLYWDIGKYINLPKKKLNLAQHIKPSLILFIPQVATMVYVLLDKTMLGKILGDMAEVGFYEQGEKIVKILMTIITTIGTVMTPRIASCIAEKQYDKINFYLKKSYEYIFFIGIPMVLGLIAVADNFCPLFFGEGYDKVPFIMICLSPIILFISMSSLSKAYLVPAKRMRAYYISMFSGTILNFLLNLFLIPVIKSYGAAIATIAAELLIASVQLYCIRNVLDIKATMKIGLKYLSFGIIMYISCMLVNLITDDLLYSLLLQVFTGVVVYILLLVITKDEMFEYIFKMVKNYFNKILKHS